MWPFKKKDKNKLDNQFISDVLISFTLNLMGKSEDDVTDYFQGIHVESQTRDSGITQYLGILRNNCIFSILLENDKVFKVMIWLNNKPSKEDHENLKLFHLTHETEYHRVIIFDNSKVANKNSFNRWLIGFESKVF